VKVTLSVGNSTHMPSIHILYPSLAYSPFPNSSALRFRSLPKAYSMAPGSEFESIDGLEKEEKEHILGSVSLILNQHQHLVNMERSTHIRKNQSLSQKIIELVVACLCTAIVDLFERFRPDRLELYHTVALTDAFRYKTRDILVFLEDKNLHELLNHGGEMGQLREKVRELAEVIYGSETYRIDFGVSDSGRNLEFNEAWIGES
jgi:hypothetical protein